MHQTEIIREIYQIDKRKYNIEHDLEANYEMTMLRFCHIVYSSPHKVSKKMQRYGASRICVYNYKGMQAALVEFNDVVIVVFRGVDKWDELKIISKVWKRKFGNLYAHSGFVKGVKQISSAIQKDLDEVSPHKRTIYAGHSMGGAYAMLMSVLHKPTDIITFGTPKVACGEDYKEYFGDIAVTRITTENDWVPNMPWNIPNVTPYEHVGDEIIIPGIPGKPIQSHKLECYIKSLGRIRGNT